MLLLHRLAAAGLALLGLVHMGFTAVVFDTWDLDAAWFAGAGVCLVVAGLFNLAAAGATGARGRSLCLAANLLGLAYAVGVCLATPDPAFQAYLAAALFALAALATFPRRPASI